MIETFIEFLALSSAAGLGCVVGVSVTEFYIQRRRPREIDDAVQEILETTRRIDEKEGIGVNFDSHM